MVSFRPKSQYRSLATMQYIISSGHRRPLCHPVSNGCSDHRGGRSVHEALWTVKGLQVYSLCVKIKSHRPTVGLIRHLFPISLLPVAGHVVVVVMLSVFFSERSVHLPQRRVVLLLLANASTRPKQERTTSSRGFLKATLSLISRVRLTARSYVYLDIMLLC